MIRRSTWLAIFICVLSVNPVDAQSNSSYKEDTTKIIRLIDEANRLRFIKPDSCLPLLNEALQLSRALGFREGEAKSHLTFGEFHRISGNLPEALQHLFTALRISREINDTSIEGHSLSFIGIAYIVLEEFRTALNYLLEANEKNKTQAPTAVIPFALSNTGVAYQRMGMFDSALFYQRKAWKAGQTIQFKAGLAFMLRETGIIYARQQIFDSALYYYRRSLGVSDDVLNTAASHFAIAKVFYEMNREDSFLHYGRVALNHAGHSLQKALKLDINRLFVSYFLKKNRLDSVVKYQHASMALQDSLFGREPLRRIQLLAIQEQALVHEEQQKQQQIALEQTKYRNRIRTYVLGGILTSAVLIGFILYRNNRKKQIANRLLEKQKNETEKTLSELRATQAQLIQSEKMSSLGQLTAGIAHEIQNPLNFVNNFSEVSSEMLDELNEELTKGDTNKAKELAVEVKQNLEKIVHHGKRADAIVKGMLQHSRTGTGQKELTDINLLAEEYLRLAFHGLRAKDKTFSAGLTTDFDDKIGRINIVPQDIGRVLVNLLNNAFYAVHEKRKEIEEAYEPHVILSTKRTGEEIEIRIQDNGKGISADMVQKIFQPFFTTKPTGQGTGLGLSLSYDIIKSHGGQLKVETQEGRGTTFIVILPY